jgi:hypothetical protein
VNLNVSKKIIIISENVQMLYHYDKGYFYCGVANDSLSTNPSYSFLCLVDSPKIVEASNIGNDSLSFPKPILKRTVQGQPSERSHSRKVRFPSPDIEMAIAKQKARRKTGKYHAQPFGWMAKRPRRKARQVDIDRLLEEDGTEELWDDLDMIGERSEHDQSETKAAGEEAVILTEK